MLTQSDYDKVANWIDASYEVAVMFKEGTSLNELQESFRWDLPFANNPWGISSMESAIRFWLKEQNHRYGRREPHEPKA